MGDGWQIVVWGCVAAHGALTLLRCVADEVAHTTGALKLLERRERAARQKRNEEGETESITVAETAI